MAESISAIGTAMFNVALNWQIYLLTHSALALGLVGMANFLPVMLFSLLGGTVADAFNRKKILYVTQSIIILCSALLVSVILGGAATFIMVGMMALSIPKLRDYTGSQE